MNKFLVSFGRAMGGIVGTLYQSGREAVDQVWKNILPFLAFVAVIVGIMNGTGLGTVIANALRPLASSPSTFRRV